MRQDFLKAFVKDTTIRWVIRAIASSLLYLVSF